MGKYVGCTLSVKSSKSLSTANSWLWSETN